VEKGIVPLVIISALCHNAIVTIKTYRNKATRDIALGLNTKETRKTLPEQLHQSARNKIAYLAAVASLGELRARAALGLHRLKGDRAGQYAIKINDQYRICFVWSGVDAELVEIVDYH
jgi:proteic killer suppression protein